MNYLPAGPTAILFALLAQYHAAIPHTFKYRISTNRSSTDEPSPPSILLSDKSTTYLLAAQLALSQFPSSILPAIVGWVVGHAWRAELLPGRATGWRVPGWLYGYRSRRVAGEDRRDAERYEGLRRRLEGESRAAAAAAVAGGGRASGIEEGRGRGGGETGEAQQRRPLAGQILDRFRGAF